MVLSTMRICGSSHLCCATGVRHGVAVDKYRNFDDFPNSLHTLMSVCFGEWVFILRDLEVFLQA